MIPREEYKTLSDTELAGLLKVSDHAAFTEIHQRYYYLLFVHAFKKLQDEEQAKDVLQEVFTRLWLKKGFEGTATNLAGYLYTAVKNRIFNLFAHQQVKSKYTDSIKDYLNNISNSPADQQIREYELQECIEREINALPPKMKRVFEMSRKQYLSYQEIAKELNTTDNNVTKQVNNALRILKVKLNVFFTLIP